MTKGQACHDMKKKEKHRREVPQLPTILRLCLKCDRMFPSTNPGHRICDTHKDVTGYVSTIPEGFEYQ
jgi:hypothetical protein